MRDAITIFLLLCGAFFSVVAALGIVRMPDLFLRMQAAAKTGTIGVGAIMLAVAVHFGTVGVTTRAGLIICFFFLTAPIAAHMIARAAYFTGVPLWNRTVHDELRAQYNPLTHKLGSGESPDDPKEPDLSLK